MNIQASKMLHLGPWASPAASAPAGPPGASPTAIAFQLAATLEAYEQDAFRLEDAGPDQALWAEVDAEMDRIRSFCAAFPSLDRASTTLFVLHEKWLQALRLAAAGSSPEAKHHLAELRGAHAQSVSRLRGQCLQRLTRRVPHPPR